MTSSTPTALTPSARPRVFASPRLVVASASNPRVAKRRAVPASHGLGMMNAPGRSCSARKAVAFCACVRIGRLPQRLSLTWEARNAERARDHLDEVALLAKDEPAFLCGGKVPASFFVGSRTCPIGFVGGQAVMQDHPPRHVVGAFVGQEVSQKLGTAPRDDAAPGFRVLCECVALEGIDLVADDAGDLARQR